MDELGHILREARENKGLTLEQVQDEIRINTKYLAALEEGDYYRLPTAVHVRGFLRNYARFLGLDPQPLLDRYQARKQDMPKATSLVDNGDVDSSMPTGPITQENTFFEPVNFELDVSPARSPESALRLVIIAALIVAVGLVANRFIPLLTNGEDGSDALTEGINEVIRNLGESETNAIDGTGTSGNQTNPDIDFAVQSSPVITTGQIITSTSRNNFGPMTTAQPAPTRPQLPATIETIELRLEITERTWMEVTIDGDVVFTGIAKEGDPAYEFTAEEEAKVVSGNGVGVFVYINDIAWGRMGARGENREEIWRTTN